jgi:plasmid stabilization system protein ParE
MPSFASAMKYQIGYTSRAEADIHAAFEWIAVDSPQSAAKWRKGLIDAIETLQDFPLSGPLAPESMAFKAEIRQLLYGKEHGVYRILYTVRKQTVYILHIRHSARKRMGE